MSFQKIYVETIFIRNVHKGLCRALRFKKPLLSQSQSETLEIVIPSTFVSHVINSLLFLDSSPQITFLIMSTGLTNISLTIIFFSIILLICSYIENYQSRPIEPETKRKAQFIISKYLPYLLSIPHIRNASTSELKIINRT